MESQEFLKSIQGAFIPVDWINEENYTLARRVDVATLDDLLEIARVYFAVLSWDRHNTAMTKAMRHTETMTGEFDDHDPEEKQDEYNPLAWAGFFSIGFMLDVINPDNRRRMKVALGPDIKRMAIGPICQMLFAMINDDHAIAQYVRYKRTGYIGTPDASDEAQIDVFKKYFRISQLLPGDRLPPHLIGDVGRLAAIGTWRYSQGVYRFDADFMAALADTLVVGDIPCEALFRLPEWSLYIETPGQQWLGDELHGYWAHLEYDVNAGRNELRLLLDTEQTLIPFPIHLGPWTVTESVDRAIAESKRQLLANKIDLPLADSPDNIQLLADSINPLISLLLYICSDAPEIDNEREPGTAPKRPKPTKTRRGWRLFPAEKPRVWTLGRQIGQQLRTAAGDLTQQTGRGVKPHLRRGHWHGYWTGPRDGERRFIYKWLMPIAIGAQDGEK